MENTEFLKKINKSDAYALEKRLKKQLDMDFSLVMKKCKEYNFLVIEIFKIITDSPFYLEISFVDNACIVTKASGEIPFDIGQVFDVFTTYFKDRFGPDYVEYLNDTAIKY